MSDFTSPAILTQEQFESIARIDLVNWSGNSFSCVVAPPPPSTATPSPPPSTTLTPSPSPTSTEPPSTTPSGPPPIPTLTIEANERIVRIGSSVTFILHIGNLVPGRGYRIAYNNFLIKNLNYDPTPAYADNDGSIILNGEENLITNFTATDVTEDIPITFYNPTGVKLFEAVYDGTYRLKPTEVGGKKIQTIAVADQIYPGRASDGVDVILYFEKKLLTKCEYDPIADRTVNFYNTQGAVTRIESTLVIEGATDFTNIDEFFDTYALVEHRNTDYMHADRVPKLIDKTDVKLFTVITDSVTNKTKGATITFEHTFTDPGFPTSYFNKRHSSGSANAGRTKYIEVYYLKDYIRYVPNNIMGVGISSINGVLLLKPYLLAASNTLSFNYSFNLTGPGNFGTMTPLYQAPLFETDGYIKQYIDPAALFDPSTAAQEYALVTNRAPEIDISVDNVHLDPPAAGAAPTAANVSTLTLTITGLTVGRYYDLSYTMTGVGVVAYEVTGRYIKPDLTVTSNGGNYHGSRINDLSTPYGSHLGDYPTEGGVTSQFDFSICENLFKDTSAGIDNPPPRGFVATATNHTFTFKVVNRNGVIAYRKGNVKATVGGYGFRCYIQDGSDFLDGQNKISTSLDIKATPYGVVELNESPLPAIANGSGAESFSWNSDPPCRLTAISHTDLYGVLPHDVVFLEDYLFLKGDDLTAIQDVLDDYSCYTGTNSYGEWDTVCKDDPCMPTLKRSTYKYGIGSIREDSLVSPRGRYVIVVTTTPPPNYICP